jgi:RNA recognition motif-containing protein
MASTSSSQQAITQEARSQDTIYIGNLPLQYATEVIIEKILQKYGRVERVSIVRPNDRTAYAFGQFATAEQAQGARQALYGRKLGGRILQVRPARSSSTTTTTNLTEPETPKQLDHRIRAIQEKLHQKAHFKPAA